jgi:mono/diheme cytochrome c family protein
VADLPSDFWGGWIAAITIASFVALLWFIIDVYRSGPDGNEGQVWDETLREGTKPAPIWWFWFILALMIVSVIYVMLYPGLGTWRGALGWSMGGRLDQRFVDYEGQFGTQRKLILNLPLAELADSNAAMRSAWHVFNNNCSSCHGRDAAGLAQQFPDLTDAAWQWGSDESQIIGSRLSVRRGSTSSPIMCSPWRAARPPRRRRFMALRYSSNTAWPAMGSWAKATDCSARRRSMTPPGITVVRAATWRNRLRTGGTASCPHSAAASTKRRSGCWRPG